MSQQPLYLPAVEAGRKPGTYRTPLFNFYNR
jgi:hypothetical protein